MYIFAHTKMYTYILIKKTIEWSVVVEFKYVDDFVSFPNKLL